MQDDTAATPFTTSVPAGTQMKLLRGQSHWAQLQRGALIDVAIGCMVMKSHVWLDNAMLSVQAPLQPGEVYLVPTSGWFELAVLSDVVLWQHRKPAPMMGRWRSWLMARVTALRMRKSQATRAVTFQ